MNKKIVTAVLFSVLLLLITLPAVFSFDSGPMVAYFSLDKQTEDIKVLAGDVKYELQVASYNEGQVKTTFSLQNMETGYVSEVFADTWLDSYIANKSIIDVVPGQWLAIIRMEDNEGRVTIFEQPFEVFEDIYGDYRILEIIPDPVLVEVDDEIKTVTVRVQNLLGVARTAQLGWRWMGDENWTTKEINLGTLETKEVVFNIAPDIEGQKRTGVFAINPLDIPPGHEIEKEVDFILNYPDLETVKIFIKDRQDGQIIVDYLVKNFVVDGLDYPVNTDFRYGIDGRVIGTVASIELDSNEEKRIKGIILPINNPRSVSPFGEINYSYDKPFKPKKLRELTFNNFYKLEPLDLTKQLDLYAVSLTGGSYRGGEMVSVTAMVGQNKSSPYLEGQVEVVLRNSDTEAILDSRRVTMQPGEERAVSFTFQIPRSKSTSPKTMTIEAEINPSPREYEEIDTEYSNNNIARSKIIILPQFDFKPACPPDTQKAIVGYKDWVREYRCGTSANGSPIYCDEVVDGVTGIGRDTGARFNPNVFMERITVEAYGMDGTAITPPNHGAIVKAGMGFAVQLKTKYENELYPNYDWGLQKRYDIKRVYAEFPDVENKVYMVPRDFPPRKENTWYFPRVEITRGQGDMGMLRRYETLNPLNVDPDTHIDGGNVHYTSFYYPDGEYPFSITGYQGGVTSIKRWYLPSPLSSGSWHTLAEFEPRLNFCIDIVATVSGSPHDDYIFRRVDPHNPFPYNGRKGWNWQGYEYIFNDIKNWWATYDKEDGHVATHRWTFEY